MTKPNRSEGAYVAQARRLIVARRLKEKATQEEADAKVDCANAMNYVQLREFEVEVEGKKYDVLLDRPTGTRISVVKLYTLVREGEISLDDFLDVVTAKPQATESLLGESRMRALTEPFRKALDLIITEK